MSRHTEHSERLTKEQSFQKRNASSILGTSDSPNNKNTSKTTPDRPFRVDGKDIYVIDSTTDTDNVDVQIIPKTRYEDRSAFLSKTTWPEIVGPQFEMLNGTFDESSSTATGYSKSRTNARSKSINLLDHINQDTKNVSKENPVAPSKHTTSRSKFRINVLIVLRNLGTSLVQARTYTNVLHSKFEFLVVESIYAKKS